MIDSALLLAVSDLHVSSYTENREIVSARRLSSPDDWLLVCGDIAEKIEDVERALALLRARFQWPLVHGPTRVLRYSEFAQWCGTD